MPLDIALSVIFSLLSAHWFGVSADPALILFGAISILLPDIDVMLPRLWPTAYNHRSFLHYPLLYVPVTILVYVMFDVLHGTLFLLCILAHFIHDTVGLGWGVAWFGPFSKRKFLFPDRERRKTYGIFMTWLPPEEASMVRQYANPHWVRDYYLRPNIVAYIEYGALVITLIILGWYFG